MAELNAAVVLDELLDGELIFDATTNRGLTSHLPMALVAKVGLGAPPEELTRFAARYRRRLVVSPDVSERLTRDSWTRFIGVPDAYADLAHYFDGEIDRDGIVATVRAHLEHLLDGLSGAAFHGVIRLAYALDVASPKRVGAGLAYWAANAAPLAPLGDATAITDDPMKLLQHLANMRDWHAVREAKTISEEMCRVASQDEFRDVASLLAVDEATSQRLADVALALYATTDDFTALHGVTGLEAISKLRPYVDDVERFDRASFQALAAAYLTIGAPAIWSDDRLDEMTSSTSLDPSAVESRAALSGDEHVAKIVFTSKRLHAQTQNPLYRAVAERAVQNDGSVSERIEC
jgi:hypothetical protein